MQVTFSSCETSHQYAWSWHDKPACLSNKLHDDYHNATELRLAQHSILLSNHVSHKASLTASHDVMYYAPVIDIVTVG